MKIVISWIVANICEISTVIGAIIVSSKIDFHQSGTEKGTRERVRSKVTKFGYHYNFLSSF